MPVAIDDPLVLGMSIRRPLPIHDSSRRLRELNPGCPRVHGVAVMGDLSRRRWWPLTETLTTSRLQTMFGAATADAHSRTTAAQQLAATFSHVVIGRVIPLLALEGRAWDTGPENLWVHVDSAGAIDWVGVVDPTVRGLPDDPLFNDWAPTEVVRSTRVGIVALPSEAALTTWIAHRSHRALGPLFHRLAAVSNGAMSVASMWHIAGGSVVAAATQVPLLTGSNEAVSMRRGQAVLDAFASFGLPVRGTSRLTHSRSSAGKGLHN